jgi:hypothetical protein
LERTAAKAEGKASAMSVYLVAIGTAVGWLIGIAGLVHSFMK